MKEADVAMAKLMAEIQEGEEYIYREIEEISGRAGELRS